MQYLQSRIQALIALGDYLTNYSAGNSHYKPLSNCIQKACVHNGWFTQQTVVKALRDWGTTLESKNIEKWLKPYDLSLPRKQKTIALILAGNIPLVGLHDLISVWVTGHYFIVKCASKDLFLLPFIAELLVKFADEDASSFLFTKEKISDFDAVIATGSDNSARYFEYYFSKIPHIIRKNRNGIAVLSGNETTDELEGLGGDILHYFGLGCRNVSKIYLPSDYDFNLIFKGLFPFSGVIENTKYANNYDYNKAIFLMSEFKFRDNGFFLLKEGSGFAATIATAYFEYYSDLKEVVENLNQNSDKIQCVISHLDIEDAIPFGTSQNPNLWNYADGIDTLSFLLQL